MAAAARIVLRSAAFKVAVTDACGGVNINSAGISFLRLSPSCSLRLKTQKRHAAHFTFQSDPVPTTYGTLHGLGVCGAITDSSSDQCTPTGSSVNCFIHVIISEGGEQCGCQEHLRTISQLAS